MPLTTREMADLAGKEDVHQMASRHHIMVSTNDKVFKLMHDKNYCSALLHVRIAILEKGRAPTLFINPVLRPNVLKSTFRPTACECC